jgi:hypothetical protein
MPFSVWLAEQGMDVTGLDLFREAIAMADKRATNEGVDVAFVCGDLFAYVPASSFDLVFDSGCLIRSSAAASRAHRRVNRHHRTSPLTAPGRRRDHEIGSARVRGDERGGVEIACSGVCGCPARWAWSPGTGRVRTGVVFGLNRRTMRLGGRIRMMQA